MSLQVFRKIEEIIYILAIIFIPKKRPTTAFSIFSAKVRDVLFLSLFVIPFAFLLYLFQRIKRGISTPNFSFAKHRREDVETIDSLMLSSSLVALKMTIKNLKEVLNNQHFLARYCRHCDYVTAREPLGSKNWEYDDYEDGTCLCHRCHEAGENATQNRDKK